MGRHGAMIGFAAARNLILSVPCRADDVDQRRYQVESYNRIQLYERQQYV
jgi:hypothetical protein